MSSGWKSILDDFVTRRTTTGFVGEVPTVYRYTRNRGFRHRRELNPITQKYYDGGKEADQTERTRKRTEVHQQRANERRKNYEGSKFDILTLIDRKTKKPVENEIGNSKIRKSRHFTTQCTEDYDSLFGKSFKQSDLRNRRNYDIINNRYHEKHDERVQRKLNSWSTKTLKMHKKYRKNFYDPILQDRDVVGKNMYRAQAKRVNHDKIRRNKQERENIQTKKRDMNMNRMRRMMEREENIEKRRLEGEIEKLRRIENKRKKRSYVRNSTWVSRGYDIMNNQEFDGIDSRKPLYLPKLEKKRGFWDRLTT